MLTALLFLLQAPIPLAGVARVERDIPGRWIAGFELRLDAYLPPGPGPHPALILIHGGAWIHGDKADMREFAELLAPMGYACFAPNYRLATAHRWPAQIEDCLYAVQFVRANAQHFDIDPGRIGALGLSAGGHLAAMLGVLEECRDGQALDPVQRESSRVQCVVDYFGPVLLSRERLFGFATQPPPELLGDAPDPAYARASPVNHVSGDDAPFLLVHGDADRLVAVEHSLLMEDRLRRNDVPCELFVIPGAGHGEFFRRDPLGEYWKRTERFLAANLKLHRR